MTKPIAGSLEYWAQQKPNEPAIIDESGNELTWKDWNDKANQLAEAFIQKGINPLDIVAVRSHIRKEWFIINRAFAKIGCSTLTVNWRLTPSEVRYMIEDSGAKAIVFDDEDPVSFTNELKDMNLNAWLTIGTNHSIPGVDRIEDIISRTTAPLRFADGKKVPKIVYTSGTTGKPKGVHLPLTLLKEREKEITEYMLDMEKAKKVSPSPENKTLLTLPLHHGAGPHAAELAHSKGNTVVLLKRFNPERSLQLIEQYKISTWVTVPTMLKRVAALPKEILEKYDVSSITFLSCGAAPVSSVLKQWAISYFGENVLYESYGSSETGLVSLIPPDMIMVKLGSSGRPYKNVHVSVRDEQGNPLPQGVPGELWIKSPMTIESYLNREPLGPDTLDKQGYFRVGDVGYLDEDGYLYITDRKKDMIISGGVNIYPAEIESVLLKHPAIQDVAVIGIPHDDFGEQVKAFCELKTGANISENELHEFSKKELAVYKLPRSIEIVQELPRNTMGKLLKNELRAQYWRERERNI
ncbi:class I adenylate-forming enzyme family protein [Bacillus dakarensis]|uniref:class I adenylate-forming enzyme family protein n=1 Tax=Robertmurraya dakarensis TaxID=1926278 RepID=UPI0009816FB7|nr:AMP-binding protein [Bacillus dakarensis]